MHTTGSHFQSISLAVGGLYSQHCLQLSQTIYTAKGAQEVEAFYFHDPSGSGKAVSPSSCLVHHFGNKTACNKLNPLHALNGESTDICRHPNVPWLYEVEGLQLYSDELDAILYSALKQCAQWQTLYKSNHWVTITDTQGIQHA